MQYQGGGTHGKQPLQSKRRSPSPLIKSLIIAIGGTRDNDLADRPAHLKSTRDGTSKGDRDDLASVRGGVSNEESPWDAFKRLSDDKYSE